MERPDFVYRALVAEEQENGSMKLSVKNLNTCDLPAHDVLVNVHYSSLNYKDALSASGNPGVTKSYPHTPGIDAAGVVKWSKDSRFSEGDEVIVTSYDLGQNTPGGYGEYISVPADWIVPLPEGFTLKESMIFGTAGFMAAYGVEKLVGQNLQPGEDEILVTGATGGVGSLAVTILSHLGYKVIAVSGKKEKHPFLKMLGADTVLRRDEITDVGNSPLLTSRWDGAIDTVGGDMLDAVIRQTAHNGTVACCGNILGGELNTSIYSFILRGVSLMGVDSGICLMNDRVRVWNRLSGSWKPDKALLEKLFNCCRVEELPTEIKKILNGDQSGRIVVTLRD